ncbi:ComEC/Rec2 family competence protein [Desulfurobacterium sp.]
MRPSLKLNRHTLFTLFLLMELIALKLHSFFVFPFMCVAFVVYIFRYGIKDLLIGGSLLLLIFFFFNVFSPLSVSEVEWIFEKRDARVALLTDGSHVPVTDDVSVGDVISKTDGAIVEKGGLFSLFKRWRFKLAERLENSLDYPVSALVEAVTLGVRFNLPESIKTYMALSGVYPLLAISGLHVVVIFGFIAFILRIFRLFSLKRTMVVLSLLMPFTGFPVSAVRAYLFILFIVFLKMRGRKIDYLYITLLIALLMGFLFEVTPGFVLSFLGVVGVSVATASGGWGRRIFPVLFPFLFTLPYALFRFGTVNLFSPVSLLLTTPLFVVFLFLCFLAEVTLFKIGFLNGLVEKVAGILIVFVRTLFNATHCGIVHPALPFSVLFVVAFVVFLVLIFELDVGLLLLVFAAFIAFLPVFQDYIYGVKEFVSGRKLNSAYFLVGEGQKFRNSTLMTDYVFPYARRVLKVNGVTVKQNVK